MTHVTYHRFPKTQSLSTAYPHDLSRFDRAACRLWRQRLTLRRWRRGGASWDFHGAIDLLFLTVAEFARRSRSEIDARASALRIGDSVFHSVMASRRNGDGNGLGDSP